MSITHLAFGREFTRAIEAKQVAQQESERAKFVVAKAEQLKQAAIIRAEGESEAAELISAALAMNGTGLIEVRRIDVSRCGDHSGCCVLRADQYGALCCAVCACVRAFLFTGCSGYRPDTGARSQRHVLAQQQHAVEHGCWRRPLVCTAVSCNNDNTASKCNCDCFNTRICTRQGGDNTTQAHGKPVTAKKQQKQPKGAKRTGTLAPTQQRTRTESTETRQRTRLRSVGQPPSAFDD